MTSNKNLLPFIAFALSHSSVPDFIEIENKNRFKDVDLTNSVKQPKDTYGSKQRKKKSKKQRRTIK